MKAYGHDYQSTQEKYDNRTILMLVLFIILLLGGHVMWGAFL